MSSHTLFRLSGLSLLAAFLIQVAGWLMHPSGERIEDLLTPLQGASHLTLFMSWVLALLGLPGLYAWQASKAGKVGLVAFAATIFAAGYHCYLLLYEAYPAVWLARHADTAGLIATGGPLAHGAGALGPFGALGVLAFPLFGIATLRAGVVPRWTGWVQILCLPVMMLPVLIVPEHTLEGLPGAIQPIAILYYLVFAGYAGSGYTLWSTREVSRPASMPSTVQQPALS
jgi:hypothetical protein